MQSGVAIAFFSKYVFWGPGHEDSPSSRREMNYARAAAIVISNQL